MVLSRTFSEILRYLKKKPYRPTDEKRSEIGLMFYYIICLFCYTGLKYSTLSKKYIDPVVLAMFFVLT